VSGASMTPSSEMNRPDLIDPMRFSFGCGFVGV
jgi:hypothetical protein